MIRAGAIVTALAALAALVAAGPVVACSCIPSPPPLEALEEATEVFLGRVIALQGAGELEERVVFAVLKAWKGVETETFAVTTPKSSAACGFSFHLNKTYLVYAHDARTGLCTRTSTRLRARPDLRALGPPAWRPDPGPLGS